MTKIDKFVITCQECELKKIDHETTLHVDWGKEIYVIKCMTCGAEEIFNGQAERTSKSGFILPKMEISN